MKYRNRDQFVILQYVSDALAITVGLMGAFWLRFQSGLDPDAVVSTNYISQFWWAFFLWIISLVLTGCIIPHPRVISFNRMRRLLVGSMLALMMIAVRNYFFRIDDVARLLFPLSLISVLISLILMRVFLQLFISKFLLTRGARAKVLIVGLAPMALRLAARFIKARELAYDLVGFVALDESRVGRKIGGVSVLGSKDDLRRLIRDNDIDEIFVAQSDMPNEVFQQLFLDSERETARLNFVPSLAEMLRSQIYYDEVAGVPVYSVKETPLQGTNAAIKRAFDLVVTMTGVVLISPVLLVIALLVRWSSRGPILYKQTRVGLDRREFKIYKFRTMKIDAEKDGPAWGSQDDPRATRIGRFLRKFNLDELPQLWNVLRGDMSLVGPRPERPYFVDRFRELVPLYMSRHTVKSGITGWAQVHGLRGDCSIQQRLRYDLYYIENWSLWLDVKILLMTFFSPKCYRLRRKARMASLGSKVIQQEGKAPESCEKKNISTDGSLGLPAQAGASVGPSQSPSPGPEQ